MSKSICVGEDDIVSVVVRNDGAIDVLVAVNNDKDETLSALISEKDARVLANFLLQVTQEPSGDFLQ